MGFKKLREFPRINPLGFNSPPLAAHGFSQGILIPRPLAAGIFIGRAYDLYYGYFSDLILPFGAYFLLSMNDATNPFLRKWYVKAGIVFSLASFAEICQFFGIEAWGVTFDPFDIGMYGAGVLIAAFVDVKLFANLFGFW